MPVTTRDHVVHITNMNPCFIWTNGHDSYEPSPTTLVGLRWRTSSSVICILDNSLARTSIDRHEDKQRGVESPWHGIAYKKQLLLPAILRAGTRCITMYYRY